MKHLSHEALVDLAEGGVGGHDHLDVCVTCRERVESMRQMMGILATDHVPEPSPLFWEHLSRRVDRALDEVPSPWDWGAVLRWGWVAATAAAIIVIAVLVGGPAQTPESTAAAAQPGVTTATGVAVEDANADAVSWTVAAADDSWQIVEGAAADLDLETAVEAGIFIRRGSLDRELLMLSDQERSDLARAIRAELDRLRL
jgi:hypothetical protein